MATVSPPIDFFRAGGTLHLSTPSYITRPADDELFNSVRAGHFCYILTSRQMGKSSLMIRTAARLRKEGVRTVIIDLSGLGTQLTASQWYLGIVNRLAEQLNLSVDMETWWQTRDALSVVQRFTDFIAEAVLVQTPDRVTIFFDEIDSTLKLGFTDDFFAAIRTFYNARANDPDYERLTFVLLGVATPTDLIKDRNRTPFNIGHAIDLGEFSHSDAQLLANGLEQAYPDCGNELLDRVFHWTSGHPYLTQKICHALVERIDQSNGTKAAEGIHNSLHVDTQSIDHLVHRLFLEIDAQNEDNLKFVHSNIQASTDRNRLLQIYRRVYNGTRVGEDERSPLHNRLKLIGLVRSCAGVLKVRNEIYRQVFNPDWIKQNTPVEWTRIITISSVAVTLVTIAFYLIVQFRQAEQHFDQLIITFENTDSIIDLRMLSLAKMCNLQPINAILKGCTQ